MPVNQGFFEIINHFNIKCKELEAIIKRKVYLLSEEKNMEQVVEQLIDILSEV